jgi:hypothetical protein
MGARFGIRERNLHELLQHMPRHHGVAEPHLRLMKEAREESRAKRHELHRSRPKRAESRQSTAHRGRRLLLQKVIGPAVRLGIPQESEELDNGSIATR